MDWVTQSINSNNTQINIPRSTSVLVSVDMGNNAFTLLEFGNAAAMGQQFGALSLNYTWVIAFLKNQYLVSRVLCSFEYQSLTII
jgi:hypothetical protein